LQSVNFSVARLFPSSSLPIRCPQNPGIYLGVLTYRHLPIRDSFLHSST
jgi:hypothetical protein